MIKIITLLGCPILGALLQYDIFYIVVLDLSKGFVHNQLLLETKTLRLASRVYAVFEISKIFIALNFDDKIDNTNECFIDYNT